MDRFPGLSQLLTRWLQSAFKEVDYESPQYLA